jgi:hypothetical protein
LAKADQARAVQAVDQARAEWLATDAAPPAAGDCCHDLHPHQGHQNQVCRQGGGSSRCVGTKASRKNAESQRHNCKHSCLGVAPAFATPSSTTPLAGVGFAVRARSVVRFLQLSLAALLGRTRTRGVSGSWRRARALHSRGASSRAKNRSGCTQCLFCLRRALLRSTLGGAPIATVIAAQLQLSRA